MRPRKALDWLADFLIFGGALALVILWTIVIPVGVGQ